MCMKIIEPYSAVPSWEGYEYQAHIAVYVFLSTIFEICCKHEGKDDLMENLSNLTLELEYADDFAIKKTIDT